jgi:hypothetical protein
MAKRSFVVEDSAAYAPLSSEAKALLEALRVAGTRNGKNKPVLIEVAPGRFVKAKLSRKWRKFGAATPDNIEHARNIVDLAEAAFEADQAIKQ